MNITPVASATLATVAYDDVEGWPQLEFRSGAIYRYFGVPATVHQELLGARSKGIYFNRAIRGQFSFARMSAQGSADPQVEECAGGTAWRVQ